MKRHKMQTSCIWHECRRVRQVIGFPSPAQKSDDLQFSDVRWRIYVNDVTRGMRVSVFLASKMMHCGWFQFFFFALKNSHTYGPMFNSSCYRFRLISIATTSAYERSFPMGKYSFDDLSNAKMVTSLYTSFVARLRTAKKLFQTVLSFNFCKIWSRIEASKTIHSNFKKKIVAFFRCECLCCSFVGVFFIYIYQLNYRRKKWKETQKLQQTPTYFE